MSRLSTHECRELELHYIPVMADTAVLYRAVTQKCSNGKNPEEYSTAEKESLMIFKAMNWSFAPGSCNQALKPLPHEQVFLDKFSLDNFSLLVWKGKFGNFFLDKCPCSKTGTPVMLCCSHWWHKTSTWGVFLHFNFHDLAVMLLSRQCEPGLTNVECLR